MIILQDFNNREEIYWLLNVLLILICLNIFLFKIMLAAKLFFVSAVFFGGEKLVEIIAQSKTKILP